MELLLMNNPKLREVCKEVAPDEAEHFATLVPSMAEIMDAESGVALAANQVGICKRFFIMKVEEQVSIFFNPEVLELGPISTFEEGCLSIPGTSAPTQRAQQIKLRYYDKNFTLQEIEYNGMIAVAVQHEIDHLNGKLYIDQLAPVRKQMTLDKHRKFLKTRSRSR